MATQTYKGWSVVTASTTAFTECFMVWMMFAVIGIVWVSLRWMHFTGVRPLSADQSRRHPEPTYYT